MAGGAASPNRPRRLSASESEISRAPEESQVCVSLCVGGHERPASGTEILIALAHLFESRKAPCIDRSLGNAKPRRIVCSEPKKHIGATFRKTTPDQTTFFPAADCPKVVVICCTYSASGPSRSRSARITARQRGKCPPTVDIRAADPCHGLRRMAQRVWAKAPGRLVLVPARSGTRQGQQVTATSIICLKHAAYGGT